MSRAPIPPHGSAGVAAAPSDSPAAALRDPVRLAPLAPAGLVPGALGPDRAGALQRVARLAARALRAPLAQVNCVTADAQVPVACAAHAEALPDGDPARWSVPAGLDASFCQHVVAGGAPLLIDDARAHPLVRDSRATREAGIVAYAAAPLRAPGGPAIGSVCVVDFVPRAWTIEDQRALEDLTEVAADALTGRAAADDADAELQAQALELELSNQQLQDQAAELEATTEELQTTAAHLEEQVEARDAALGELAASAAALRSSRDVLAGIGRATEDAIFIKDADGRYLWVNEETARIFGAPSATAVVGRTDHDFLPSALAEGVRANDRQVMAAGETVRVEEAVTRAGEVRTFLSTKGVWRDVEGQPAGIIGVAADVTAQKAAEATLAATVATLRGFTDSAPVLMGVVELVPGAGYGAGASDDDLLHVYDNPATERFFGAPPGAMVGRRATELGAPSDVIRTWVRAYREAGQRSAPVHFEYETATPTGPRWLAVTVAPIGPGSRGPRFSYVAEDVTTRKRAEAERERLRAAEQQARERTEHLQRLTAALVAARTPAEVAEVTMRAGVRAVGAPRGTVLRLADADRMFELLASSGYTDEEIAPWRRFPNAPGLPGGDVVASRAPLVIGRRADYLARYPQLAAWMEASGYHGAAIFPLIAGAGPAARVLGLVAFDFDQDRDFAAAEVDFLAAVARVAAQALDRAFAAEAEHAARQAAEAARADAEREREAAEAARWRAEEASRAKSQFLATMSHELRTPLNAIQGHVQLLEMELHGPVTAPQRTALARVERAQRHLLGLINDVLNYARLEAGKVEYDVRAIRVADVVADVLPMVEPQLTAKGLALDVPPAEGAGVEPVLVWADREKLGQVLLNLLSNAVKFTPAGGRVTVAFAERADGSGPAGAAFLRVTDTGPGIPADKLDAIFEPFVQVRAEFSRPAEGTGLGLAISRDLARGMGGDLRARSADGGGAAFTITLLRAEVDRRIGGERRAAG